MLKQIRKIGAAFAAVLALAGFMQLGVSAEVKEGAVNAEINWAYDTEAKTLTLSGTGALPESAYLNWEEYHTQAESLIIGAGITATGKYCFKGMTALKNITFPANDLGIEQYSFQNCTALESVTIPSTIKTLGGRAFQGCTSLKSVIIEEGVDRIVTQVFRNCANLESVKFPKSARISTGGQGDEADGNLFRGCDFSKLKVTVCKDEIQTTPDKKGYVNAYTYVRKSNETKNIYNILPNPKEDGTQDITNYISSQEGTLIYEAVDESGNVVENIEAIPGTTLFKTWEPDTNTLTISGYGYLPRLDNGPASYLGDCYQLAEKLIICNGIAGTQKHSFNGMITLKSVTFPKNDFTIGQYAFSGCTALENITIPANIAVVGSRAFYSCTNLKNVVMEEGVGQIQVQAFYGCVSLESINIPKSATIGVVSGDTKRDGNIFMGNDLKNLNVVVWKDEIQSTPVDGYVNPYTYVRKSDETTNIYNIVKPGGDITSNSMGNKILSYTVLDTIVIDGEEKTIGVEGIAGTLTWSFDINTKTLEITGNGSVANYSNAASTPWAECADVAEKLVIGEGVTSIGKHSFSGMSALKEVEIPSSVVTIAQYAFAECYALEEITIPGTVSTLYARAFRNCTSLKKVEFEEGVKSLGSQLFYGCTSLETVIIPASASIERTHVNYSQDGVLFRGITNFDNLTVYVYKNSDAYNYVTSDIYTITNYTNNDKTDSYKEQPNYMVEGGYVLKYALLDEMSMSYNEYSMTANIISPDDMTADLVFASYDFDGVTLLDVEIQKDVNLVKGLNSIAAKKLDQKAGTTTAVMLLDSIENMKALCPSVEKQFKINIYMAGDSIMRPYKNAADYPQQGWGVPFAELFDSEMVEVHNYARGGSTTVSFYNLKNAADGNYGETGYGWIKEKIRKGDYLVIGFIHNDYNNIDIETYKEYLKKYIDETRAVGATPIFVVQPPRGTEDNQHGDFPQAMMQVAEENDVFCADTDTPLRAELVANLKEAQNKYWLYRLVERGIITADELAVHSNLTLRDKGRDPTHISVEGAKWVAKFVAEKMKAEGILSEYISIPEDTEPDVQYETFSTNSYFSDNAVLQRNAKVLVTGNGPEGKEVSVTLDGVKKNGVVENGVWRVYLDAHEADGKAYTMTVTADGYNKTFKNIVFGDVYLLSGQSNMAYTMGKFMNAADYSEETVQKYTEDLKAADNYPNLRTYKMRTTGDLYSDRPIEEPMRNWNVISSTNASAFSAIGFYFGIDLAENTDVPIGMILSAISGSYLQAWLDDETIENENVDTKGKDSFYNSLIHPFTKFPIKAVLWYQGESNYNDAGNYARYLKVLISSWRENFNNPTLPFLYVQLPSYGPWDYRGIRDAQMEVYKSVDNVAMAVLTDEGEENQIHPADKETVGKRLSLLARGMFYGYDKEYRSPIVKSVSYNGDEAMAVFDYVADGLKTKDNKPVTGFEVCGNDGVYVKAAAVISDKDKVTVTAEGISEIKGVRYSYEKMMSGNIYNSENLPASPFVSK